MDRDRVRYHFVNEEKGWCYQDLIFDVTPEVGEEREYLKRFGEFEEYWQQSTLRNGPLGALVRRQDRFYQLLWPLMDMPPDRRREAVRQAPCRDPELAILLLVESEKDLSEDRPWFCEEKAQAAEWIAEELSPALETVSSILAHARALQAVTRHLLGDPRGGERLFRAAFSDLAKCPDPMPWAFVFERLAEARQEQRRLPEGAAYLSRAVELYRAAGWCRAFERRCLRRLALLHLRCNDPGRAMAALVQLELGKASLAVDAEVLLGMASCFAAVDLREPARLLLQESRSVRRRMIRQDHRLPLEWWDARVALRLGDLEEAVPRLDAVRRKHLGSLHWVEACLLSVELLLAYAQTGTRRWRGRPEVFKQLARSWNHCKRLDMIVEDERAALEAALRNAAGLLRQHRLPEASSCEDLLKSVQATPTTGDKASISYAEFRGYGRRNHRPVPGRRAELQALYRKVLGTGPLGADPNG